MPVPDTDRKRQRWLSVLARADAASFDERLPLERLPAEYVWLRQPESGLVMVCGVPAAPAAPSISAKCPSPVAPCA